MAAPNSRRTRTPPADPAYSTHPKHIFSTTLPDLTQPPKNPTEPSTYYYDIAGQSREWLRSRTSTQRSPRPQDQIVEEREERKRLRALRKNYKQTQEPRKKPLSIREIVLARLAAPRPTGKRKRTAAEFENAKKENKK